MTSTQQTRNVSNATGGMGAVHLLLTQGDVKLMVDNPEQVMEEIRRRAEQVGSLLEGILQEPHGQSCWGLNE
jgi:hypothetical protein